MTWWQSLPSDRQRDFIAYLKKTSQLTIFDNPRQVRQKEMIRDLILPTLEEGQGFIPEELSQVSYLAQAWDMTNYQLAETIYRLWQKMTQRLSAKQASTLVKRSPGTLRRWAREGRVHASVNRRGHWTFTREVLIDHVH